LGAEGVGSSVSTTVKVSDYVRDLTLLQIRQGRVNALYLQALQSLLWAVILAVVGVSLLSLGVWSRRGNAESYLQALALAGIILCFFFGAVLGSHSVGCQQDAKFQQRSIDEFLGKYESKEC